MRVLAAMSGGVDSAVAAARVLEAGHEVVGVHLALAREPATERLGARGCCTVEDAGDARRVADVLDIPFYVWDLSERFESDVIEDFVAAYAAGQTPNPCLRCNERIKFSALLDRALALGFDAVATGHYARLVEDPPDASGTGGAGGAPRLHRAVDAAKDQSYVLAVLGPDRLAHALFPLGDSLKGEVRAEAAARGLRVASKPDSHDICFVPDGDTAGFLRRRLGRRPGPIVEVDGTEVGRHEGSYAFTVGQRRGLALSRPAADGHRRYVLGIEPVGNTVVVGPGQALEVTRIVADRPIWAGPAPSAGQRLVAQVRAHGEQVECLLTGLDPVAVELERPVRGVAPGQALVLYDGSRVVGSATIVRA
jgi:tRNA-specific 2-thiouridylase